MLAFAAAAAAALAFTAPAFTTPALAQADVKVKVNSGEGMTKKKVVIRQGDRGRHEGWRHSRHYGASKVVIKRGPHKTVIKKKFEG